MGGHYKDESRKYWSRTDGKNPTTEQLQLGCLQRIADATEAMSKNYNDLFAENERHKHRYEQERAERQRLERSIVAHKSNYTRLKNKLEAMKSDVIKQ